MRQLPSGFSKPLNLEFSWYDLYEDWDLIESSFAKQYGIRIRSESQTMPWCEFSTLLTGLMPDTPLGQIVSIRSEQDQKVIQAFNSAQRNIYSSWQRKVASVKLQDKDKLDREMNDLSKMLKSMFGKRRDAK